MFSIIVLTHNSKHNAVDGSKYCERNGGKKCSKLSYNHEIVIYSDPQKTSGSSYVLLARNKSYLA
jgi:hypothetical protein